MSIHLIHIAMLCSVIYILDGMCMVRHSLILCFLVDHTILFTNKHWGGTSLMVSNFIKLLL